MSTKVEEPDRDVKRNGSATDLEDRLKRACRTIAPVWPLESFVTVNPYHGLIDRSFVDAAERLRRVAGARTTMPVSYYLDQYDDGTIGREDLADALREHRAEEDPDVDRFLSDLRQNEYLELYEPVVPSVGDVARVVSDRDWSEVVKEQVSDWAATYFDEGQTMWPYSLQEMPLFAAWKEEATIDRTPEVLGLEEFRRVVEDLPDQPVEAAREALTRLEVPEEGLDLYLERLLYRVVGWSAYGRKFGFERELEDSEDSTLLEFLCVQLCWEVTLLETLDEPGLEDAWEQARDDLRTLGLDDGVHPQIETEVILQTAYDHADHQNLQEKFAANQATLKPEERPELQAAFCIDVRSEVLRRHLEEVGTGVETFGFPGFFGFPIEYYPLGHEQGRDQCPPLLTADYKVEETLNGNAQPEDAEENRQLHHHVRRTWKAFKWGAISCFSFVGPLGLAYLPKLFTDDLGWTRTVPHPDEEGLEAEQAESLKPAVDGGDHGVGIPDSDRVDLAEDALRALSLTENFAPLVMLTGHGSTTVNNPYDAGLDCGACGGNTGTANVLVGATILNDPTVREGLRDRGIDIPEDTVFLAAKHDTTTDEVDVLNPGDVPERYSEKLDDLNDWFQQAGERTRRERAERFHLLTDESSVDSAVKDRSRDWSQVRPEWGLAGCNSFVVAPRRHTRGVDLESRSFLHNYEWEKDEDAEVLELIMTAPAVVTAWINLQYYASAVDNDVFGSGNKTLHNVVGKMGIFEGNGGDLRIGLPWQSVHDGDEFQHKPARLKIVIEAPHEAMNEILANNETIRHLCENGWIQLFSMDDSGDLSHRYRENGHWEAIT